MFDAFASNVFNDKYAMPMPPTQLRQVHSKKWFAAKEKSLENFQKLYIQLKDD